MTISERNRKCDDNAFIPVVWEKGSISRRGSSSTPDLASVFRKVFLPAGYPQSVRPEYLQYQLYDSLQGLCSYLRAVLCYRGIFAGAGVGDAAATPLAAALGWVLKDGVSICGSLIFAYFYAESFEVDIKEWRLLADVLNNIGLTLDLLTGWVGTRFFFALASMSALSKALCGLVAGATKARIAEHFARDGHLADVVSKEGTQETAVSLVGLLLGMAASQLLSAESYSSTLVLFIFLTAVHQWANWKLVKVLVFDTLSSQKLYILADELHRGSGQIRSPQLMTAKETLWRPIYLGIFGPSFGGSLQDIISASSGKEEWSTLTSGSWVKYCILGFDRPKGRILVCLPEEGEVEDDDDNNKDGVEVKKIIAHLIGFYVFCVVREQLLTRRIGNLDTPVSLLDALPQLSKAIPEIESLARGLSSVGWTITKGSSRLGDGAYRYRITKKTKKIVFDGSLRSRRSDHTYSR